MKLLAKYWKFLLALVLIGLAVHIYFNVYETEKAAHEAEMQMPPTMINALQSAIAENARYVDAICFYNSGAAGLGVTMLSCGDKFCLNFKQSFESDKYVKAFCAQLDQLGVSYSVSDAIPFVTPRDSLIKRKGEGNA